MAQLKSTNILGNLAVSGDILSSKFIKLGGASTEILMADGAVATIHDLLAAALQFSTKANDAAWTPEEVRTKIGSGGMIRRGTWDYSGNGYIAKGSTAQSQCPFGAIDLAGATVLQANAGPTAYTQLYITASTSSGTTGAITGEMIYYIDNGSNYTPTWRRVLTNNNFNVYSPALDGTGATGDWGIDITGNAATATTATTATKLGTSAGDSNTPVYFSSGKPVACSSLDLNTSGYSSYIRRKFDRDTSNYLDAITFYKADNTTIAQYIGFHNTAGIILNPNYDGTTDRWTNNAGLHIGYTFMRYKGTIGSQGYVLETTGGTTQATMRYSSDYNAIEFVF